MVNTRRAAGLATVGSILLSVGLMAVLLVPKFKNRALGAPGQLGRDSMVAAQVQALKAEVARLQALLSNTQPASCPPCKAAEVTSGSQPLASQLALNTDRSRGKPNEIVIDLHHLLGSRSYFEGISFDTFVCAPPLDKVFPGIRPEQMQVVWDNYTAQLTGVMAGVLDKAVIARNTSLADELLLPDQSHPDSMDTLVADPRTSTWRDSVTTVMARFMVHLNGSSFLSCPEAPKRITLENIGQNWCPSLSTQDIVQQIGYHPVPYISLDAIAGDALKWGICTKAPDMAGSFGQWIKEKRMFSESSKTFNVKNLEEDAVVFLFDMLYEKLNVFKRQYWLGTIAMQNPLDMLSISDIIHTVRPDLIIETGTANGGSALLWASILHLNEIHDGRVITIDVAPPAWDPTATNWGGAVRADATQHPLWKKHVTFIQGSSTENEVFAQVKKAAQAAKTVLVLLDSLHSGIHVKAEAQLFCPFVTVDSYCIIEDTKLSRFAFDGPLQAAQAYVERYPYDFETDRDRELLFTHHAMGYLKRIGVQDATAGLFNLAPW